MIGADNRGIYHVLWKQKGVLADFTEMIYISQLLKSGRIASGKVKISTEAQGKRNSSGHGIPWKAQRQPLSPSREKKWKTKSPSKGCLILEREGYFYNSSTQKECHFP